MMDPDAPPLTEADLAKQAKKRESQFQAITAKNEGKVQDRAKRDSLKKQISEARSVGDQQAVDKLRKKHEKVLFLSQTMFYESQPALSLQ